MEDKAEFRYVFSLRDCSHSIDGFFPRSVRLGDGLRQVAIQILRSRGGTDHMLFGKDDMPIIRIDAKDMQSAETMLKIDA
jgi:hypothetical protein